MKSKNIKLLSGIFLISLFSVSCTKVLDRKPQDAFTDLNYWQNVDQLKLYANNFYTGLAAASMDRDDQSDNVLSANTWLYNEATVPQTGGGWNNNDWTVIRNANYFLARYHRVTGIQAEINQYVGEIRFFRAYNYFDKVKRFGDVPWINKDLNVDDSSFLYRPRTPRKQVIDSILADLQFSADNMLAPGQLEKGRLHKYAALQLLARVALYEGTWMKYRNISGWQTYLNTATATAKKIMDEGGYDIVKANAQYSFKTGDVVDAKTNTVATRNYPLYYKDQFIQEDLTTNKECVLPRIYVQNLVMHGTSRHAGVTVDKDFIEDFLCADGLPIRLSPLYKGDDSVTLEMADRDPRFRNTIDNRFLPYYANGTIPISNYLTAVDGNGSGSGYLGFKFRTPVPAQNEANQTTYDLYIFRYAEVLLIYAEAKAELGTLTQADLDISINKLRARLDEPSLPGGIMGRLTLNPPADPAAVTITGQPRYGYTLSPLIYEIRRERRIELSYEGFRWDDIVRWKAGKLIENPKTMYGFVASNDVRNRYLAYFGSNMFAGKTYATINDWDKTKTLLAPITKPMRVWNDRLYLRPIPREQITLSNKALEQNPGWE